MSDAAMDPTTLLGETRTLRLRSRSLAHGGAWLPALVLAGLPVLSGVLYRAPLSAQFSWQIPYQAGLPASQRSTLASYVFWLMVGPIALGVVALWYRRRALTTGVRLPAWVPIAAGGIGLTLVLAVFLVPSRTLFMASPASPLNGLLSPLLSVGLAAVALGWIERSLGIVIAGLWLSWSAWQACAVGRIGGLFGWQAWLLDGGGPRLGGQVTLLGANLPLPALLLMSLPLAAVGALRMLRPRQ